MNLTLTFIKLPPGANEALEPEASVKFIISADIDKHNTPFIEVSYTIYNACKDAYRFPYNYKNLNEFIDEMRDLGWILP